MDHTPARRAGTLHHDVRCLDDFNLSDDKLGFVDFDGRNWDRNVGKLG